MASVLLLAPMTAHAADDNADVDGRLEGYGTLNREDVHRHGEDVNNVALPGNSVTAYWLIFIVLSVVGCSVLFKSANRSHLD